MVEEGASGQGVTGTGGVDCRGKVDKGGTTGRWGQVAGKCRHRVGASGMGRKGQRAGCLPPTADFPTAAVGMYRYKMDPLISRFYT